MAESEQYEELERYAVITILISMTLPRMTEIGKRTSLNDFL